MCVCMRACMCARMYVCVCVPVYMCVGMCGWVCLDMCVYGRVLICIPVFRGINACQSLPHLHKHFLVAPLVADHDVTLGTGLCGSKGRSSRQCHRRGS